MLFYVILVMFAIVLLIKLVLPDKIETNLTLYLTILVISITSQNMNKDAFIHGYWKLQDETKV